MTTKFGVISTNSLHNIVHIWNEGYLDDFWQKYGQVCGREDIGISMDETPKRTKITLAIFIERSNAKHGAGTYDYSLIDEKELSNVRNKVSIICQKHGKFQQMARSHYEGNKCWDCGIEFRMARGKGKKRPRKMRTNTKRGYVRYEHFIEKSTELHNGKFDYSLMEYSEWLAFNVSVDIICPVHGKYDQNVSTHFRGHDCIKCAQGETNKNFTAKHTAGKHPVDIQEYIDAFHKKWNNLYDYSKCAFKYWDDTIIVICPLHGEFKTIAYQHKREGRGTGICPLCKDRGPSRVSQKWLDHMNIPNDSSHREVPIPISGKKYRVDGFDPNTNTVYEFLGDYWHGNPKLFGEDELFSKRQNITFGDKFRETMERFDMIRQAGYNLVYIWEDNWAKKVSKIRSKSSKKN